ncbi:hypothetical protein SD70_27970 [Gordoniibacillus kamchatkensis]|uniref:Uncharacterized protein n=1 Tax=Gordoniibacillus kamchatkensis TaxID=1590651 RepID=A0ABR5AC06_9BACL|nr:hypothetical protein [Paenibacillus sp. VKM B-2647]KIL38208.1 hypothetical protein SD70_27970 [Paenibacillus sp. VKM B-2647]
MNDGELTSGPRGAHAQQADDTYLPPRKTVHPSEKGVWTRRFYAALLWLFVTLTAALLIWGYRTGAR